MPSWENRDLRQLLWHRHRMVQARTRIINQLQAVALNEGLHYKKRLWRQMMGRPANERITVNVGRELCLRTGSKALLGGTISSLGSDYLIDLNAMACTTGDTLAKEQGEATSKEDVLTLPASGGLGGSR